MIKSFQKIKMKVALVILMLSLALSVGMLSASATGYQSVEISTTQATYPRMNGTDNQIFSYVNKPIDWDTTKEIKVNFSLSVDSTGGVYDYNANRNFAFVMNDITTDNTLNYTLMSFYQGASSYSGVQFVFKSANDWNGNMQMAVYDGMGQNNTGAYAHGWDSQFTATEGLSKESGAENLTNFSNSLYFLSSNNLTITRDAEYYNFKFESTNPGHAGVYTYSVKRDRISPTGDFVNDPYIGFYACDYGATQSTNMGFNINSVEIVEQNSIVLSQENINLTVGETETLTASVQSPSGETIADEVTFSGYDEEIISIVDGQITALKDGTTTITATSATGLTASLAVTINKKLNKISVPYLSKTMVIGESYDYVANVEIVEGSASSDTTVTYTSSNENVVVVENGKLVSKGAGKASITATTVEGVSNQTDVYVLNAVAGQNDYDCVTNYDDVTTVVETTDGFYYSAMLNHGDGGADRGNGRFYLDMPLDESKVISFDLTMVINGNWKGENTYYNIILNDIYDESTQTQNIDKVDLNLTAQTGLDGFQTRFVSDAGWNDWNCMQYGAYSTNGQLQFDQPYSANYNDAKINEVVRKMRNDEKFNVQIIKGENNYTLSLRTYDADGNLTDNVWQIVIPADDISFENPPYLALMVNNCSEQPLEMGFVISNFLNGNVESLSIEEAGDEAYELSIGENDPLTVTQTLKSNALSTFDNTITFTSSDTSIVSIGEGGKLIGVKPGNAVITVTDTEGNTAECDVAIDINSLTVTSPLTINAFYGEEGETIVAVVDPVETAIKYESSNTDVVTVDAGKLTYVGLGSAVISVFSGLQKVEVTVNVDIESLTLNKTDMEMDKLDIFMLRLTPSDLPNVTWSSADANIASVDENGKVTALNAGTVEITASVGTKTVTCNVVVKEIIDSSSESKIPSATGCNSSTSSSIFILIPLLAIAIVIKAKKQKLN